MNKNLVNLRSHVHEGLDNSLSFINLEFKKLDNLSFLKMALEEIKRIVILEAQDKSFQDTFKQIDFCVNVKKEEIHKKCEKLLDLMQIVDRFVDDNSLLYDYEKIFFEYMYLDVKMLIQHVYFYKEVVKNDDKIMEKIIDEIVLQIMLRINFLKPFYKKDDLCVFRDNVTLQDEPIKFDREKTKKYISDENKCYKDKGYKSHMDELFLKNKSLDRYFDFQEFKEINNIKIKDLTLEEHRYLWKTFDQFSGDR